MLLRNMIMEGLVYMSVLTLRICNIDGLYIFIGVHNPILETG
jgi:hypothetical protein